MTPGYDVQAVRRSAIDRLVHAYGHARADAESLVAVLEQHKRSRFGSDHRMVLGVHTEEQGDQIRVYAVTGVAEAESAVPPRAAK